MEQAWQCEQATYSRTGRLKTSWDELEHLQSCRRNPRPRWWGEEAAAAGSDRISILPRSSSTLHPPGVRRAAPLGSASLDEASPLLRTSESLFTCGSDSQLNEPRVDVCVLRGGAGARAARREPARVEISCVSCNSSDVSWYRGGRARAVVVSDEWCCMLEDAIRAQYLRALLHTAETRHAHTGMFHSEWHVGVDMIWKKIAFIIEKKGGKWAQKANATLKTAKLIEVNSNSLLVSLIFTLT